MPPITMKELLEARLGRTVDRGGWTSGVQIVPPMTTADEDARMVEDDGCPGVILVGVS